MTNYFSPFLGSSEKEKEISNNRVNAELALVEKVINSN